MADPITWGLINGVKKGVKTVQSTLDGLLDDIKDEFDIFIGDAEEVIEKLGTGLPPRDLAAFSSQSTEDGIKLTFTPPAQTYIDDGGTNQFAVMPAGVLIRYSDTGYPRTPDEGKFGYDYKPTGDWVTTSQECTIVGLTKDTKYYFTAFPYSTEHVYNKNQVTANRTEMTWVGNKGTISVTVQTPEGYEGTLGEYTITLVDQASDSPQNVEKSATGAGLTQFGGLTAGKSYKVRLSNTDDLQAPPDSEAITIVGGVNYDVTMTYALMYGTITVNVSTQPAGMPIGAYTVTLTPQGGGDAMQQSGNNSQAVVFSGIVCWSELPPQPARVPTTNKNAKVRHRNFFITLLPPVGSISQTGIIPHFTWKFKHYPRLFKKIYQISSILQESCRFSALLFQKLCKPHGYIGTPDGCNGFKGGIVHLGRVVRLVGDGPDDHKGNPVLPGGVGNGCPFHFCAHRSRICHDLLFLGFLADKLVSAGYRSLPAMTRIFCIRRLICHPYQHIISGERPYVHSGNLSHRVVGVDYMAVKIVVNGLGADDQVTDVQLRGQAAGNTGIDHMGHSKAVCQYLDAQGSIHLTHTALNHHHRQAGKGPLPEYRPCQLPLGAIFHFFLEGRHFHIHGPDNAQFHILFSFTQGIPAGLFRDFPTMRSSALPKILPWAGSCPDSCRSPWHWLRGLPPHNLQ